MAIPDDIAKGTPIYWPTEDGLYVFGRKFSDWVPSGNTYARTTSGHTPNRKECFLTKKEAAAEGIKRLKKAISELENERPSRDL